MLLSTGVEEKTLEDDRLRTEEIIARLKNSVSILERCNRDWSSVLKDLKGEEKEVKEEKELQKMVDGNEGYVELLLDAGESVARLETRLKRISTEQEKIKANSSRDVKLSSRSQDSSGMKHESVDAENITLKVNLPKLHLPFLMAISNNGLNSGTFSSLQSMNKIYLLFLSFRI